MARRRLDGLGEALRVKKKRAEQLKRKKAWEGLASTRTYKPKYVCVRGPAWWCTDTFCRDYGEIACDRNDRTCTHAECNRFYTDPLNPKKGRYDDDAARRLPFISAWKGVNGTD